MGDAKEAMKGTIVGMILRTITLILFCILDFKLWSLVIALSVNIFYVTIHHIIVVRKKIMS